MRIVIVEDDILFAEEAKKTMQDFFMAKGEVVDIRRLEATTLLEELNGQNNYDIYLFDVEMPGMRGSYFPLLMRNMPSKALGSGHTTIF